MKIVFDEASKTECNCDYVTFWTSEDKSNALSVNYSGRDGSQNWPTESNPFVIPGDKCVWSFHSDGSVNDWGVKFTVTPAFPEGTDLGVWEAEAAAQVAAREAALAAAAAEKAAAEAAIAAAKEEAERAAAAEAADLLASLPAGSLVKFSSHPYEDGLDTCETISIEGATSLTITFSEKSSTEANYDHVLFMPVGEANMYFGRFSGGRGDSPKDFPGVGEQPPLIIIGNTCDVRFHSDASNNDW